MFDETFTSYNISTFSTQFFFTKYLRVKENVQKHYDILALHISTFKLENYFYVIK